MPRTKVASSQIADGVCTLLYYSDPAAGPQTITATLTYRMSELTTPTVMDLAAYGFASLAGNRYQRETGHPDVPAIATALYEEMKIGNWSPGKPVADNEPTDLMRAIAEAYKVPLETVQQRFETQLVKRNDGTVYTDKNGKPRKAFSLSEQRKLAANPLLAPIMARLAQERARALTAAARDAKDKKAPPGLLSLFDTPEAAQ